ASLGPDDASDRRSALVAAMTAVAEYERDLCAHLLEGLARIPGVRVHGITDREQLGDRVPTVVFEMARRAPAEITRALAAENVFAWNGNYYALEVMKTLGFEGQGGLTRIGLAHYNTVGEIDRLLDLLGRLADA
ncbi:MAG: aminotransferase class V-fold PLP-dependent enzyme, partial [Acidobacteriota bacterium]|nr:aminotransferase class V-fold PLP-dependent enzyme [Acidobacteriota bacterium]